MRAVTPLLLFPALVFGASIENNNLSKDLDDRQLILTYLNGFYNPNGGNPVDVSVDLYVSKYLLVKVLVIFFFL